MRVESGISYEPSGSTEMMYKNLILNLFTYYFSLIKTKKKMSTQKRVWLNRQE